MASLPNNLVCAEICDALGLKNVTKLELKMEVDNVVTVNATYFPEVDGMKQILAILKKYKLVERGGGE